jgi:GT2 family glycosyltransferase
MHSDVLPMQSGWVKVMLAFRQCTPRAGAIGCRLLYPDGAIQHQGLLVARSGEAWRVRSPLKGLAAKLAEEPAPRAVSAVSTACLLIDRELFQQAGGFCGEYLAGEHEDADLCVRLAQSGRTNWLLPSVSMHHLESQSRSKLLIDSAAGYNAWRFNERCSAMLDAMAQNGGVP